MASFNFNVAANDENERYKRFTSNQRLTRPGRIRIVPKKNWYMVLITGAVIAIASPIIVYSYTFGIHISADHNRWAEMGSAMSGIYTPALSALTVVILFFQLNILKSQTTIQSEMAKFTVKESVARLRQNMLDDYQDKLEHIFPSELDTRKRMRDAGIDIYFGKNPDVLDTLHTEAISLHMSRPEILDAWCGVYVALEGLENHENEYIRTIHGLMILKIATTLSSPVAIALDNYHYASKTGRFRRYKFSRNHS